MIDMANEKNIMIFNATYDRNGDKLGAVKEVFDDTPASPSSRSAACSA